MSNRYGTYFWETLTFEGLTRSEYIFFDHLKDSPEAKDVIFPFLLPHENANMRRVHDVLTIYFADYGDLRDIERILNNAIFSLYGFKSSGEKTLLVTAPLFIMPVNPSYTGVTFQPDPMYKRPYMDIEMKQICDFFNIVLSFPDQRVCPTYAVKLGICVEAITKYHELVFKAVVIE